MKNKMATRRLCVTAVMLALATVLSLFKIYKLPLGGSITLLSMLPIVLIAINYGTLWGLCTSFLYSLIQLVMGIALDGLLGWGLTPAILIGCILFDYIFAFSLLGLAGVFRRRGNVGICLGVALALFLRFLCHFISGSIFFRNWEVFHNPYLYSLCYNGSYMLPELVFTLIGTVLLLRSKNFCRVVQSDILKD